MLYAALGDSITFGYSSSRDANSYVNRLKRTLSNQQQVNVYQTAKPGWTSKQLLRAVKKVPPSIWEEAKVITILVGGNDALRAAPWLMNGNRTRLLQVSDNLQKNLSEIISIVKRRQNIVLLGTLYNPFPNSLMADECTDVLNRAIRKTSRRQGVWLVELQESFAGREPKLIDSYKRGILKDFRLIRANPVHPNDAGHRAIAQAFLRTYRSVRRQQTSGRHKNRKIGAKLKQSKKSAT